MYGVAGLKRIPTEFILSYKLAIPSIEEQEEICEYIENIMLDIEESQDTNIELINKLKQYKQSLISEAVTGKIDVRDLSVE